MMARRWTSVRALGAARLKPDRNTRPDGSPRFTPSRAFDIGVGAIDTAKRLLTGAAVI
jgi:hypothetical protein